MHTIFLRWVCIKAYNFGQIIQRLDVLAQADISERSIQVRARIAWVAIYRRLERLNRINILGVAIALTPVQPQFDLDR